MSGKVNQEWIQHVMHSNKKANHIIEQQTTIMLKINPLVNEHEHRHYENSISHYVISN